MPNKGPIIIIITGILLIVGLVIFAVNQEPQSMNTTSNTTQTADSGLVIEDLIEGEGAAIQSGDSARMHYTLYLSDGTMEQTSKDGNPFTTQIGVGQVIQGWDQGIPGMKVGGTRKLTIPPELAYGANGQGGIPPNETLTFEVELLEIL